MPESRKCSKCGTPLNDDASEGFCPACMLEGALNLSPIHKPESAIQNSKRLGDYELLDEIARGGMGVVYRGRQISLDRLVAVKLILIGQFADKAAVRRFKAEATAAARLRHPNIVAIHEIGEEAGQHFFSMDYVDGPSLADFVRQRPISFRQSAHFLKTIAETVHYAHEQGIVHRDLKPSNILIDSRLEPRITDFGLARDLKGDSDLTLTGQVLGSPNYISPEQASGKAVGAPSDIYSLGAILYHVLCGRPPFAGETLTDTLHQVTTKEAVSPRLLDPSIPRDLETICLKCLEKEPAKRYPTAAALAQDLGRFLENAPITARPVGKLERAVRWCRRKPALASVVVLLAVVAIGSPIAALRIEQERRRATTNAATAQAAVTRLEIENAEHLFDSDNSSAALAYLARILRRDPTNRVAAERILWALSHRNFSLPAVALKHSAPVNAATFSPDGAHVATASHDETARVWDAFSGKPVTPPLRHDGPVSTLQFNSDGRKLVTGSGDKTARVWDADTGQALTSPLQHSGAVVSVAFSPNGKLVGTASEDGTACVWHVDTGKLAIAPFVHSNRVRTVCFSPDGKRLLTGSGNFVVIWDIETGRQQRTLNALNTVHSAKFSNDGKTILAAAATGFAVVWDAATEEKLRSFGPFQNVFSAEFSPEEARVAVAGSAIFGRPWGVWDVATGQAITPEIRYGGRVSCIRFSPDGAIIVTASEDNTARIWVAESGRPLSEPLYHSGSVISAEFSPNAHRVLTVSEGANAALIWDIRLGPPPALELPHGSSVAFARFSPDGRQVATVGGQKITRMWDSYTGNFLTNTVMQPQLITSLTYSFDSRRILTASHDGSARVWDAHTAAELCPPLWHGAKGVWDATFSPDGSRILTAGSDGAARVWNPSNGVQLLTLHHDGAVRAAKFSPDGHRILTGSEDHAARMWDTHDGRLLFEMKHHARVNTAEFSRDGMAIVTASEDKLAQRRDARTGQLLGAPMRHKDAVTSASFSPDGSKVLTLSGSTVHIWHFQKTGSGDSIALRHSGGVQSAVFTPDGRHVLTASSDQSARVWDADTGHPLSERIQHPGPVNDAQFSPDGRWIITAGSHHWARILEVPIATFPTASWLPDLAEAVAGQRLDPLNVSHAVNPEELLRIRERLIRSPGHDAYTRWAKWFFADSSLRTLFPSSTITVHMPYKIPAFNLLRRDPSTPANMIDLSKFYNMSLAGRGFAQLPESGEHALQKGPQALANVLFDIRGAIRLASSHPAHANSPFPRRVGAIDVSRKCDRLHFLDFVIKGVAAGTTVGTYVVHYTDGTLWNIPLNYGDDVLTWIAPESRQTPGNPKSVEAWTGRASGLRVRLFKTTWENPKPEVQITTIDFISNMTDCAPVLVAITAEP